MTAIKDAFGIAPEDFWAGAQRLHELEVLDMYEDEVARNSDQVLATYFFYLAFFKDRVLDFATLLESFFPRFSYRIVDALNPLLNAFNSKALCDEMRQQVADVWVKLEESGREEELLQLMHLFWFLKETDTLLYLHERIAASSPEPAPEPELNFNPNANVHSPSILSLLSALRHVSNNSLHLVIDLLLDYLAKRPKDLPYVLHLLTEDFGYRHTSHLNNYEIEKTVINVLWRRAQENNDDLLKLVYLTIAEYYLRTHFSHHEAKGHRTISVIQFDLAATPELFELRQTIWQGLLTLYRLTHLQKRVLGVLLTYCSSGYYVSKESIIKSDSEHLLSFITSELKAERYDHCLVAQSYLEFIERHKISFDKDLRARFRNETYITSELLLDDRSERAANGWEEYGELKKRRIKAHFASYTFDDYKQFFAECDVIKAHLRHGHDDYVFQGGVITVLFALADTNASLFVQVLDQYLEDGNQLALDPHFLVAKLIEFYGAEPAYEILARHEYKSKGRWLFEFFEVLPSAEVKADHLKQLYDLYQTAELESYPHSLDFLTKYLPFDKNVFVRVAKLLTKKAQQDSRYGYYLANLFNPHADACKGLREFFADGIDVLKKAYFAAQQVKDHSDFSGTAFNAILDLDPNFAWEYIEWRYGGDEPPSRHDDSREYEFLWRRDDYEVLMANLVEQLYKLEQERDLLWYSYLEVFFRRSGARPDDTQIEECQDQFLGRLIEQRFSDIDFVDFLFGVISNFSYDRRRAFVALFLRYNRRFEDFTKLQLESSSSSYVGSKVPMLQERVVFYESLLPLFDTVDLLKHRQHVEQVIERIRGDIERAKKSDFMEN